MRAVRPPRPIDHVVLPTADLEVARRRYDSLGFTVAPDADHPFGTRNACLHFSNGTYVEALAVARREDCAAAIQAGNRFVAHDDAFRFRNGADGFSALAFGTSDAAADEASFLRAGICAGAGLSFARRFAVPGGETGEARFRLAFAGNLRAPDALFFTCERVGVPTVERGPLEHHRNGVTGIVEVVLSEPNPSDFQYLMQEIVGQRDVSAGSFGMALAAANGQVSVLTPVGMNAYFPAWQGRGGRGLRLEAVIFSVADLASTGDLLERVGIVTAQRGRRLIVAPAPGQGAHFAFEER